MNKATNGASTTTDILFRIDMSAIPENINITEWLQQQGTQLFMVQHSKPENFHYHGYIKIQYSEKTFRRKLTQLLPLGGNKSYSIKTKYDNLDKYLSYCLYRKGDPIELISNDLGVDVEYLKEFIPKPKEKRPVGHNSGIQNRLNELLELDYSKCKRITDYTTIIMSEYHRRKMNIHLAQIRQLSLSVYLQKSKDTKQAISDIVACIHSNHEMAVITDREFSREYKEDVVFGYPPKNLP